MSSVTAPPAAHALPRLVSRRRRLPGTRPVLGALIVAAATVTCFAGYTQSHRAPHQLYVVAARTLRPGTRITASDLAVVALNIPDPGVRRQVFGTPASLVGASVIAPVDAGALVESSAVVGRGGALGTHEISLTVDRGRAVGGTLKAGEYVDVLGTFGNGSDSYTSVMVPHVRVLTISSGSSALGDSHTQTIVLAAPDGLAAEALADGAVAAQLTLVRAAEQADSAPATTAPTYRPPAPNSSPTR